MEAAQRAGPGPAAGLRGAHPAGDLQETQRPPPGEGGLRGPVPRGGTPNGAGTLITRRFSRTRGQNVTSHRHGYHHMSRAPPGRRAPQPVVLPPPRREEEPAPPAAAREGGGRVGQSAHRPLPGGAVAHGDEEDQRAGETQSESTTCDYEDTDTVTDTLR